MRAWKGTPAPELQREVVRGLRGDRPTVFDRAAIEAALARYECAAYLGARRSASGAGAWPEVWESLLAQAHRRTAIESLVAIGQWKEAAGALGGAGIRSLLLKGIAYFASLYPDPGWRPLVDVDLLMRKADLGIAVRQLEGLGYRVQPTPFDMEFERLSMERPGTFGAALEIHWSLGAPHRPAVTAETLLEGARDAVLDGVEALILPPEEGLVYHVAHAADHYFGPTLKWALDLREMLGRWSFDWDKVEAIARRRRARSAVAFAREQHRRLFPAEPWPGGDPEGLSGHLVRSSFADGPAEFLWDGNEPRRPWLLRWLLADGTADVCRMAASAAARPLRRASGRAFWAPEGRAGAASD